MKKILFSAACFILLSTSVVACSNKTQDSSSSNTSTESSSNTDNATTTTQSATSTTDSTTSSQTFTLEDLKQYNGQNGAAAYVAVDGIVYDVTNAKGWENGEHQSGIVAGADLTDDLAKSPHGDSVLGDLPVVGTLE